MKATALSATTITEWRRSLAARVAGGQIAFFIGLSLLHGMVLFWMINSPSGDRESPAAAEAFARAVVEALDVNPRVNVAGLVAAYADSANHAVLVALDDGRTFSAGELETPRRGPTPAWTGQVRSASGHSATVVLLPRVTPALDSRILGAGLSIVVVAGATWAWLLFLPVRKRLVSMETAVLRIGQGDLSVRVEDTGADEVATVARAFNRMTERLQAAAETAAANDIARRQFLADISHELRTPLTIMRGSLETIALAGGASSEPHLHKYITSSVREVERLERLVDDLLDMAVMSSPDHHLTTDLIATESLFGLEVTRFDVLARRRRLRFVVTVGHGAELLTADPHRMVQALHNLVSNAVRHTPDGGRISMTADVAPGGFEIRVSDTGGGIPHHHLPHIFDRFYTASTARQRGEGTGLGLAIVKAIMELHGGHVSVNSTEGQGTTFVMYLPTSPSSAERSDNCSPSASSSAS